MKARYNSSKEEMENYCSLPYVEINKIVNKAEQCIQKSTIVKSLGITLECLTCILMYCD